MRLQTTLSKNVLLLVLFLCSYLVLFSQTLVASYPFNGNANDASGNGNTGTVFGATLTSDRFGNANSAYSFNGSNNWIQVANSASLQLGNAPYTISAWVKPSNYYNGGCQANFILSKGDNGSSEGHYNLQYGDFLDGSCGVYSPSLENFATSFRKGSSDNSAYTNPATIPVLGAWFYVVGTYDGTNLSLYVNGKLLSTQVTTGTLGTLNTNDLFIGRHDINSPNPYFVNGVIDDIKIYNGALSSTQIFDTYINDLKKPGSGNALVFDNTNSQYIDIGTGWDPSGSFSFETWVKRTSTAVTDPNSQTFIGSVNNGGLGVGINQNSGAGAVGAIYLTKVGISNIMSTSIINDTRWHHVAVTFDAASNQAIFYIDGVADAPMIYNSGGFNSSNSNYRLAGRDNFPNFNYLNGSLDEVRIWDGVVLTQTQIRDWMCKKITSSHPAYNNLKGYYRLDEGSGSTVYSIGGHPGSLINSPTWTTSGAALGDASVHDYVNAIKTASINTGTGESFTITSTSGSPSGIHVYRVDTMPNTVAGANSGGNNKYFGAFQAGGTNPQYTAVYNYSGNPLVNANNESNLRLFKRTDNSITVWTDCNATQDMNTNTFMTTGQSTEYLLGSSAAPLPVTLLNFKASKQNGSSLLSWVTSNETGFDHFDVEKSNDGRTFQFLQTVSSNGGNRQNQYQFLDMHPSSGRNYYRLKMTDQNGQFKYSQVITLDFSGRTLINVYPNPVKNILSVYSSEIISNLEIVDITGKTIRQFKAAINNQYNVSDLEEGIYFIRIKTQKETNTIKFSKL